MATRIDITKFDNLSDAALADEIGELDCQAKAIEARIKDLKLELTRRGVEKAEGERFNVTKSEAVRWSLDTKVVREELGEAWCNARSKVAAVVSFRITPNRAALAAAACRRSGEEASEAVQVGVASVGAERGGLSPLARIMARQAWRG